EGDAATPARPDRRAGARLRAGLAVGVDPPPARRRDPRGQPPGVANDPVFRAGRGRVDGADLGGAGRARRARAGATGQRLAAGDLGGALVFRRTDGGRGAGLRVRPADAAHQGVAGGRRAGDLRQRQLRLAQLPPELRGLGAVPRCRHRRRPGAAVRERAGARAAGAPGPADAAMDRAPARGAGAAAVTAAVAGRARLRRSPRRRSAWMSWILALLAIGAFALAWIAPNVPLAVAALLGALALLLAGCI